MSSQVFKLRAGVCDFDPETKICTPVPCQGEIEIKPNEEEDMGFWDFQWHPVEKPVGKELSNISLILIPGETLWVPVNSCKNGRIFALVFSSNERYLFWLQEKNPATLQLNELGEKERKVYEKMSQVLNVDEDVEMKD
ncbi:RPN13 (YLR421C) [Zygosaccharomyces parabailii]|uniref:ZYBA0S11-02630g1_1 n=1 Tax=Zygosaccharomyces bailii (strain CLIB 213 / ATCC 58445 / CBS 680 / BCRC 21525 / NBRC 1098 / NCYC 1416 / NRRL Y-2227) TaxID=1333698 RepID=A0A8J2X4Q8_ZYGB2|nr:RPN13 (YLR421C) [Zygosaccharomyces parabailii]CDF91428.1 ZYBA0S11-02630g1_1 [Zygosaccharomyces bailii CLIB 213]CDH17145.1 probable 26S proteasome regulatory subunit RPN13 [Zygosaccharomyces bailii ISA1307]SJM86807.1 probable 26S proteasome regulatory subunit RPN13 [Zygosaccharomyces bailii]